MRVFEGPWFSRKTAGIFIVSLGFLQHLLSAVNPSHGPGPYTTAAGLACMCMALCILRYDEAAITKREFLLIAAVILTVCAWTGPRALSALYSIPHQQWVPCNTLQSSLLRWECRFYAGVNQHYALRTFYALAAAVLYGCLAFLLVRRRTGGAAVLATSLVISGATVVLAGFVSAFFATVKLPGLEQWLPENLMFNAWGRRRMSQIIGNPSWVWPYLGPLFAWSLYRCALPLPHTNDDSARGRGLPWRRIAFAAAVCLALMLTRQRSAWLMAALMIATTAVYILRRLPVLQRSGFAAFCLRPRNIILLTISGLAAVLGTAYAHGVDEPRLRIWTAAVEFITRAPWTGHGYASWFQLMREYTTSRPAGDGVLYDTAHNLYLQLFAELGLVHGGFCIVLLAAVARTAWRNASDAEGHLPLLAALGLTAFLTATLIQEVDYILPTLYLTAAFWGGLAGLSGRSSYNEAVPSARRPRDPWGTAAAASGVVVFGGAAVFALNTFAWGASAFEAPAHLAPEDEGAVLTRWLSRDVTLPAAALEEDDPAYLVYPLVALVRPGEYEHAGRRVAWSGEADDLVALVLEPGKSPRQHIRFARGFPDNTRFVAAMAVYPPLRTNLGILHGRHMEPAPICKNSYNQTTSAWRDCSTAYRCPGGCEFSAVSCGRNERLDLHIRPEGGAPPVVIALKIYATNGDSKDRAGWGLPETWDLVLPPEGRAFRFEEPGAAFFVSLTASAPVLVESGACR